MRIHYLPNPFKLNFTLILLGLLLASSQALTSIGSVSLLPVATAQQFEGEPQDGETREHISHGRPSASPNLNDPNLRSERVFRGLEYPTAMAFLGPDDILVAEKDTGRVQRIVHGELQESPAIDVAVANNDERGLLGIAVSNAINNTSGFNSQYVFLYFTESGGGNDGDDWRNGIPPAGNRVYRYTIEQDGENGELRLVNGKLILDLPGTPGPRYNGGPLAIGPDGNVYVIIGDLDHHTTRAQNFEDGPAPDGTSGVIRITQDGKVADIPGIISDKAPLNLYYAYGMRQSFGMAFDPVTRTLWDTENGPSYGDEINLIKPGFNSGWAKVSGLAEREDNFNVENDLVDFGGRGKYSDPQFVWQQTVAPTGLDFLTSNRLGANYQNDLFVGDYNNGNLYHFDLNADRTGLVLPGGLSDRVADTSDQLGPVLFGTGFGGITDIAVGPDGYLYVLSFQNEGTIFKIALENQEASTVTNTAASGYDTGIVVPDTNVDDPGVTNFINQLMSRIIGDISLQ
jgi:glucose/arabinose dehydrogenase